MYVLSVFFVRVNANFNFQIKKKIFKKNLKKQLHDNDYTFNSDNCVDFKIK